MAGVANTETSDLLAVSIEVSFKAAVAGADTVQNRSVGLAEDAVVRKSAAAGETGVVASEAVSCCGAVVEVGRTRAALCVYIVNCVVFAAQAAVQSASAT